MPLGLLDKRLLRNYLFFVFVFVLAIFLSGRSEHADACTLWAAVGNVVDHNGTLIAKNRDWKADHVQELRVIHPAKGFSSVVLYAVGNNEPGIKAGVNERGLVIVSATAGQYTQTQRLQVKQPAGLMRSFLKEYATVREVISQTHQFHRPGFYLVADRNSIAIIEVADNGRIHVEQKHAGILTHTNHYCSLTSSAMRPPAESSVQRLARINQLMTLHNPPYSLEDFIRFSVDTASGPDNSIWRTGSSPSKARTLATWIVSLPQLGSPILFLKTANPGEAEKTCTLLISEALKLPEGTIPFYSELCMAGRSRT